jgi:hypothetical protein
LLPARTARIGTGSSSSTPVAAEAGPRGNRKCACGPRKPSIIPAHICKTCSAGNRPQLFPTASDPFLPGSWFWENKTSRSVWVCGWCRLSHTDRCAPAPVGGQNQLWHSGQRPPAGRLDGHAQFQHRGRRIPQGCWTEVAKWPEKPWPTERGLVPRRPWKGQRQASRRPSENILPMTLYSPPGDTEDPKTEGQDLGSASPAPPVQMGSQGAPPASTGPADPVITRLDSQLGRLHQCVRVL